MLKHQIEIGDIVSSKIHPYYPNITNILISGDALQLPPLMVVTEIFRKRESVDVTWEDEGVEIFCKCLWYSSRLNKYQSEWLRSEFLKIIAKTSEQENPVKGNQVAFKTIYIELGKKKSTLTYNEGEDTKGYTSITSLLTFLPPVMQIVNIIEFKVKKNEPLGSVNSLKERWVPKFEARCIWYNNNVDKFSEVIIPIEALQTIAEISPITLNEIHNAIASALYYQIEYRLVKPQSISARSGLYFLRAYDLVQNASIEIPIFSQTKVIPIEPFRNLAPKFDTDTSIMYDQVKTGMVELITTAIGHKSFLRLQYKNRNDRVTVRTLKEYNLREFQENGKKIILLTGYCFLRKEHRTFRLERIQNLQELNLSF